jgi:hypothetical protein
MRRMRLAWILPPILAGLNVLAIWDARHPHPPVHGDIYWHSTFELFFIGLNAPAMQMTVILYWIFDGYVGLFGGDLISVSLVALLWYLAGRKIDSYRFAERRADATISVGGKLRLWLTALYGLYLLIFLCLDNLVFSVPYFGSSGGSSNFVGEILRQSLWLVWSLVLLLVPVREIVRSRRRSAGLRREGATG